MLSNNLFLFFSQIVRAKLVVAKMGLKWQKITIELGIGYYGCENGFHLIKRECSCFHRLISAKLQKIL